MKKITLEHRNLFIECYYHWDLDEPYLELINIIKAGYVLNFLNFSHKHRYEITNRLMRYTYVNKRPAYLQIYSYSSGGMAPEKINI